MNVDVLVADEQLLRAGPGPSRCTTGLARGRRVRATPPGAAAAALVSSRCSSVLRLGGDRPAKIDLDLAVLLGEPVELSPGLVDCQARTRRPARRCTPGGGGGGGSGSGGGGGAAEPISFTASAYAFATAGSSLTANSSAADRVAQRGDHLDEPAFASVRATDRDTEQRPSALPRARREPAAADSSAVPTCCSLGIASAGEPLDHLDRLDAVHEPLRRARARCVRSARAGCRPGRLRARRSAARATERSASDAGRTSCADRAEARDERLEAAARRVDVGDPEHRRRPCAGDLPVLLARAAAG